ncbi:tRNA-dependent cyclodipeptide synthase [Nocardia sp. CA-136227]|uniref:tRNA-dependent cyclodipeptide synthase n=1 Tax=Nocardia sp. CA-136227 TaxID=3239979 RepID=UPI003D96A1A9
MSCSDARLTAGAKVGIHDFADFADDPQYLQLHEEVTRAYDHDHAFRRACVDMSRHAVTSRLRALGDEARVDDTQSATAVPYLIDELPYFLGAADILGHEESAIVYHRPWVLWNRINHSEFPIKVRPNQGFLILNEP